MGDSSVSGGIGVRTAVATSAETGAWHTVQRPAGADVLLPHLGQTIVRPAGKTSILFGLWTELHRNPRSGLLRRCDRVTLLDDERRGDLGHGAAVLMPSCATPEQVAVSLNAQSPVIRPTGTWRESVALPPLPSVTVSVTFTLPSATKPAPVML